MALNDKQKKLIRYGVKRSIATDVIPSDTNDLDQGFKLWVGRGGTLLIETTDGERIQLAGVQSGTLIDFIDIKKVMSKGTTATLLVAIY